MNKMARPAGGIVSSSAVESASVFMEHFGESTVYVLMAIVCRAPTECRGKVLDRNLLLISVKTGYMKRGYIMTMTNVQLETGFTKDPV